MGITKNKLLNIKPVIIHEFGHLIGYCLANRNVNTYFCQPIKIDLGYKNFITPSEKIFHIEKLSEDRSIIIENTKNIKRTIAWFSEVICGCDFETQFENKSFISCFSPKFNCSGNIDFANLSVIRNLSSFRWEFEDIYNLQIDIRNLLSKYKIYKEVEKEVEIFLANYGENDYHTLMGDELELYINKFNQLITDELHDSYLKIIGFYYKKFSCEI